MTIRKVSTHLALVFYDGKCGFCDYVVQLLLKADKEKIFVFAPLQGKTASIYLKDLPEKIKNADSLILLENYQTNWCHLFVYGQGAFRIAWLLGGVWRLVGWPCFLPPFLYNWCYYLIARFRFLFFKNTVCQLPDEEQKDRFLL